MKQTLIVVILLNGPVKRLAKVLGALAALAVLVDLPAAAGVNPQWDAGAAAAAKRPRVVISTDFAPAPGGKLVEVAPPAGRIAWDRNYWRLFRVLPKAPTTAGAATAPAEERIIH